MAFDENLMWVPGPIEPADAQLSHRLVIATTTFPSFSLQRVKEIEGIRVKLGVHEFLATALAGSNNDLTFIARKAGDQNVRIAYVDPAANNAALGIVVSTQDITVNLATGSAGAITSTASDIKAAIEASAAASALVVVLLAVANTGAGVVTALSQTALGGPSGTSPTLDVKMECSLEDVDYYDVNASFTRATAARFEVGTFVKLGNYGHYVMTLGGTNPVFAVSIVASYKP